MDSSDWLKSIVHDAMDSSSPSSELIAYSRPAAAAPAAVERRLRPQQDHALKCPRCDSTHTKFCYYNNYSLSQPRYFCKTCRRYWTKGGSLRNVPVGGGCRKNKRSSSAAKNKLLSDHHHHLQPPPPPPPPPHHPLSFFHDVTDLHLSTGLNIMDCKYSNPMLGSLAHCMYMGGVGDGGSIGFHGDASSGFHGGFGTMDGSHGAIMEACQRLALPFEGEEDVKPLSLEWHDQGCSEMVIGRDQSFGCTNGLGLWAGMINGHGPSAAI